MPLASAQLDFHALNAMLNLYGPNGEIYIAESHDQSRSRITKWAANGTYIETWGEEGYGPKQFRDPHALAMDSHMAVAFALTWGVALLIAWSQDGRLWQVFIAGLALADAAKHVRLVVAGGLRKNPCAMDHPAPFGIVGGEADRFEARQRIVADLGQAADLGAKLCLVIGGGNIYRGVSKSAGNMDRALQVTDYLIAEARLASYARELGEDPQVTWRGTGADLVGLEYAPPFSYYAGHERAFRHIDFGLGQAIALHAEHERQHAVNQREPTHRA